MATYRSKPTASPPKITLRPGSGVTSVSPVRFYSPFSSHKVKRAKANGTLAIRLIPERKLVKPGKILEMRETALRKSGHTPIVVKRHQRTSSDYGASTSKQKRTGIPLTQLPTLTGVERSANGSPDHFVRSSGPTNWRTAIHSRSGSTQKSL